MDAEAIAVAVRAERLSLCDLLEELDPGEWVTPSLCAGWRVQEVVAHLTVTTRARLPMVVREALRARGNFDRMADTLARRRAAGFPPQELVRQLRESAESSRRMPGSGPMDPLMDLVIHGQDIVRPLGRVRSIPTEVGPAVLSYVAGNRMLGAPGRLAGLELVATDADWSTGEGDQVCGATADLLLVATGRRAGLDQLTGQGVARLASRLTA